MFVPKFAIDHPFCKGYINFLEACSAYATGQASHRPIVVMEQGMATPKNVTGLQSFQLIWRAKRLAHSLREDPDVMFNPRLSVRERRIRAIKAGVSETTLDTMDCS